MAAPAPWQVLLLLLSLPVAAAPKKPRVDFGEAAIEGERATPGVGYVLERTPPKFACDPTRLTVAQYERCFQSQLRSLCGVQVIERQRHELVKADRGITPGSKAQTVGSDYPYSLELSGGTLSQRQASETREWGEPRALVKDVSPPLAQLSDFVATRAAFVLADRAAKRLFVFPRGANGAASGAFQKIDLAEPTHAFLGLVGERYVLSTSREVLLLGLDGRSGRRIDVPREAYAVDPFPDREGRFLLSSSSRGVLVSRSGKPLGSFAREAGQQLHLLPNGLVAAVNLSEGSIQIRDSRGRLLSRTRLDRPLQQFGVLRQEGGAADLYYLAADGLGVLYGDGFEKAFLAFDGSQARVVEAENNLLGILFSSPSNTDPRRSVERRLDYFTLRDTPSRTSRVVEGICPGAIRLAERALELRPSRRATLRNGRFERQR